jgi:circadian clock protein KaiC
MRSIDLRLQGLVQRDLLRFHAARPSLYGLEMHLATMFNEVQTFKPDVVIVDPITSLLVAGSPSEAKAMVTRLIDFLKAEQITSLFTSLTNGGNNPPQSEAIISSLMDTWIQLQDVESNGERNRVLNVLKSRGMAHSNQVREFLITDRGLDLVDTYLGPTGVMTGAARVAQVSRERANALKIQQELISRQTALKRKRATIERQVAALRAEQETEEEEVQRFDEQVGDRARALTVARTEMGRVRQADVDGKTVARKKSRNGRAK